MKKRNYKKKKLVPETGTLHYFNLIFDKLTHLTPLEEELITQHGECIILKKDEYLFKEGETPTHLLCLVSGKMKVFREGVGGRNWIARMAKPVEMVGYRALFAEEDYTASAQALEPCVVCAIEKRTVLDILSKNANLMFVFMRILAKELGDLNARSVTLTQKHLRGRLAETLLLLKELYGLKEGTNVLDIYLSRCDIANMANMTSSNAIRTLSAFNAEGIINIDGRKLIFTDEQALVNVSENG